MVSTTRRHTSQRLTLVILVLLSVTLVTLDYKGEASRAITSVRNAARDVVSPIQRVLSDIFHPIGDVLSGAVNYGSAVKENAQLRSQIGALREQVLENQTAEQQLQEILNQQHLPYIQNVPTLLAEVIGGSASNVEDSFEIDRGTSSGVGVGMPVVAGPGLVGIVASAGSRTAVVRKITDPSSSFGVRFGVPGSIALAQGRGPGYPLSLSGVTATMSPRTGQIVYTSGVEGAALPAGIPVGTIASVHYKNGYLTKTVFVTPEATLQGLDYVTVMQWFPAP